MSAVSKPRTNKEEPFTPSPDKSTKVQVLLPNLSTYGWTGSLLHPYRIDEDERITNRGITTHVALQTVQETV